MLMEAQVQKGSLWKRIIDALKDLVSEANFECTNSGISIQSMDSAHVALCSLGLHAAGFSIYKCVRHQVIGVNLSSLSKVLKVTDNDDIITLSQELDQDVLTVKADSADGKRSEYKLKLMEIEAESMGIPELQYKARLSMPSEMFAKIIRDMAIFGETVTIDVTRDKVSFNGSGDIGLGTVTIDSTGDVQRGMKAEVKSEVKRETVKPEPNDDDMPLPERYASNKQSETKKPKSDKSDSGVFISTDEPVQLSFALRYLSAFAKGSTLSERVEICLAKDSPCRIEFKMEGIGFLRWYLAPKVEGDD